MVARIDRRAGKPERIVSSRDGDWATPPSEYVATTGSNASVTVEGHGGGTADISYSGNLAAGEWEAVFHDYSADGKTFVDGPYKVTSSNSGSYWTIEAGIDVTGAHTGSLDADLIVNNGASPLPEMTGSFDAVYDGEKAPPLPKLGACYDDLPQKSDLELDTKVRRTGRGRLVIAQVTADVDGDERPVQRATVKLDGAKARTNRRGRATLYVFGGHRRYRVVATAGDTFNRASERVRVR
jgi:hypothetical protein